jgi:putative addiction module component (TIGR02574 family)
MMIHAEEGEPKMSTQMERLAIELLGLPASSRAVLAQQLIASLEEPEMPTVSDEWLKEIVRRDTEVLEGKVQCISAEDTLRRARERVQ